MKKYSTIIFDLDGTLADTSKGIYNCVRYTQQKMNLPAITDAQLHSHVGPPMHESYARNFGLSGDELEMAVRFHKEYALKCGWREATVYKGIPELLITLKNNGIKLAVATLKYEATAKKMLEYLEISGYFDVICGTLSDVKLTKAELLLKCVENCHDETENSMLIGDSLYDALGAQEASIDFIGVTYGFGFKSKEDVNEYPNVAFAHHPTQIAEHIVTNENGQ